MDTPTSPKRILVATDFSRCSQAALDYAVDLAKATHGEVTLLHVSGVPGYVLPDGSVFLLDAASVDKIEASIQGQLALEKRRTGAAMETVSTQGAPAPSIVSYASDDGSDLIVIGTHGRSGLRRLLLGSVAERVLRTAPCPVLVVRTRKEN